MKVSRSASGSGESSSRTGPTRLGPADLAPDLVTLLLAQGRQVGLDVRADRQRRDRGDVLTLDVEGPALGDLARADRLGQGVRRRVAAAQTAEVHDVPRPAIGGFGQVADDRGGDRRHVLRGRQHRGVVGVVRGTEQDGRGGRRDRGQVEVGTVAHPRVGDRVARLHLVAMHERHDRDRVGIGRGIGPAQDERLLVRVRAIGIPPGTLEGPAGERGRPRVARGGRVPGLARDIGDRDALDPKVARGRSSFICAGRRWTGRVRRKGGWGHARMLAPDGRLLAEATSRPPAGLLAMCGPAPRSGTLSRRHPSVPRAFGA